MKRSPYDVLGVTKTADADAVRSAYKKLALKWHPDKNMDNAEEATEKFKEIQAAFSLLSDPIARASLDDDGMPPSDDAPPKASSSDFVGLVNIGPYFNPSCYADFSDDKDGFYAVYRDCFAKIDAEEIRLQEFDMEKSRQASPGFEDSSASDAAVKAFYGYWENFNSKMTFAWCDEYDVAEAPNRAIRRLIEKDNKKKRDAARKRRTEHVRSLVLFVKSMDKRVMRMALAARAAAEAKAKAEQAAQLQREMDKAEARRKRKEHMEAMAASGAYNATDEAVSSGFYRADDDDEHFGGKRGKKKGGKAAHAGAGRGDDDDDSEEEEDVVFRCEACSKIFKSEKQLQNHEKSRKHLDAVAALRAAILAEDAEFDEEEEEEAADSRDVAPDEPVDDVTAAFDALGVDDTAATAVRESSSSSSESSDSSNSEESEAEVTKPPTPPPETKTAAEPAAPKLTAKQKRDARKAKKAEKAATTSAPTATATGEDADDVGHTCSVCHQPFPSRNKLFAHVKKTGHAVPLASVDAAKRTAAAPAPTKKNSRARRKGDISD